MKPSLTPEERLARVERRCLRLAVIVVLLAAAVVLKEFVHQPRVRATRIEIVDAAGRVRGMWRVQDGTAALVLRDEQGAWRTIVSDGPDGAVLRLGDRQGTASVALRAGNGQASIELRDANGQTLQLAPAPQAGGGGTR